jgi:hypothetical protein
MWKYQFLYIIISDNKILPDHYHKKVNDGNEGYEGKK